MIHLFGAALALCLIAPAPTLAESPETVIAALRNQNNAAIAAHDLDQIGAIYSDDAAFVWSDGSYSIGKSGVRGIFAKHFADPAWTSVVFVRTPDRILLNATADRAYESGTWTGTKQGPAGTLHYGGSYAAHWRKEPSGWQARGELYVKLHCEGRACTP
ncbi:hypothetical protein ASE00_19065 [Sphingomonas sp. Root710]|nr:hypothetical protein ASE00_19065 [Sphingomonas sp. Root710]